VPDVGQVGDVKNVATGYARNYLIPKGLAIKATPGAMKEFERRRASEQRKEEKLTTRAEALAAQLGDLTLSFEAKAGETGRLYGSITAAEIVEALNRETGEEFDRRKHILSEPIREVGRHVVSVRLTADVVAEVKVEVRPEGGELPEEPPAEPAEGPAEEPTEEPAAEEGDAAEVS
jgi:large subunit ribosomal protein L9